MNSELPKVWGQACGCPYGERCRQAVEQHCLCAVTECVGKEVLFVEKEKNRFCPRKMSFGYETICCCSVRLQRFVAEGK